VSRRRPPTSGYGVGGSRAPLAWPTAAAVPIAVRGGYQSPVSRRSWPIGPPTGSGRIGSAGRWVRLAPRSLRCWPATRPPGCGSWTAPPARWCATSARPPGELVHLDVKRQGRIPQGGGHRMLGKGCATGARVHQGLGYDFLHVAIDDCSRVAYVEALADERGDTSAAFAGRALGFYRQLGIRVAQVMTDNGAGYRSGAFHQVLAQAGFWPPADPPLSAPGQRQGRAAQPDHQPGMGLRQGLYRQPGPAGRPPWLGPPLQPPSSPHRPGRPQPHANPQQPPQEPHLGDVGDLDDLGLDEHVRAQHPG
jgi:transposase InsO family protein